MCASELGLEYSEKTSKFLSRLSPLKGLEIWFSDTKITQASRDSNRQYNPTIEVPRYTWDLLLDRFVKEQLAGLTDTLKDLTLSLSDNGCESLHYGEYLDDSNYSSFTKLRRLEIPHKWFTGRMIELLVEEAGVILPASLEELVITHFIEQTTNIWDILDGISFAHSRRGGFPKLQKITLDPTGHPLTKSYFRDIVTNLQKLSIEVEALLENLNSD
jgi:hypothetical protein